MQRVGHQHQPLTLAWVCNRADRDTAAPGHRSDGQRLHGGEGHHLSADFCESLGPAQYAHETVCVEADNIAGVVPAVFRRLQNAPASRLADSPP